MAAFQSLPLIAVSDDAGLPLVGGKIFAYESGTTTLKITFSDTAQTVQNTNPIILNARGEALMVLGAGAYTLQFARADNTIVRTVNGVVDDTAALSLTSSAATAAIRADLSNTIDPLKNSALVGRKAKGDNATATTLDALADRSISVSDYANATAAFAQLSLTGTGTIDVPNNVAATLPTDYAIAVFDYKSQGVFHAYAESETGRIAKRLLRSQHGAHTGTQQVSVWALEHRPTGGGFNGAANADMAANISVIKRNYLTSTVQGEIDGMNIVVRQGGPAGNGSNLNSDCAGILIDVGIKTGVGFAAAYEASTAVFDAAGASIRKIQTQVGVMDTTTNTYLGFVAIAEVGLIDDGLRLLSSGTGSYTNYVRFINTGGLDVFKVDAAGRIVLTAVSGATPSKTIRSLNASLSILDHAGTTEILVVSDIGDVTAPGIVKGSRLMAGGTSVAGGAGTISFGSTTTATVGAAGAAAAQPAAPLGYLTAFLGTTPIKIPYHNA